MRLDEERTRAIMDGLRRIVRELRESAVAAERLVGVSGAQLFVLRMLAEHPVVSLAELAERTATHPSSVSTVVAKLGERGLVRRDRGGGDRRRLRLALTAAGRRLLADAPPVAPERLLAGLRRLPPVAFAALAEALPAWANASRLDRGAASMFFEEHVPLLAEAAMSGTDKHIAPSGALPVAPSLAPTLDGEAPAPQPDLAGRRFAAIAALATALAVAMAFVAVALGKLITLVTNLAWFHRWSFASASPADNHLGLVGAAVPVAGGVIVGLMARYGSAAIRGHGIPEAMEQVLVNRSRIPARMTLLKPLSAALAIGTGGPFGAEGPIIATGGALGSLIGQVLHTTGVERKTLLAAGAAAGMAATFGSPVSAVLLAIELLLFEFRARSFLPVALAAAAATAMRIRLVGGEPVFPMPAPLAPGLAAIAVYAAIGAAVGLAAAGISRLVYAIEDGFDHLPLHWMWWPALGGIVVGVVGLAVPRTLGVGYDNIVLIIGGGLAVGATVKLCAAKLASWAIALGSGTSGGTLAPLLTIGGGCGLIAGAGAAWLCPDLGIDPRLAAAVGMAAMFAGASRALLASVVFAFEATRQPDVLTPLLAGCACAYLASLVAMRHTIMTEKIARRGLRVVAGYEVDPLEQLTVADSATPSPTTLAADEPLAAALERLRGAGRAGEHQGYPVVDGTVLVGVVTRRDLATAAHDAPVRAAIRRPPITVYEDRPLREAVDILISHDIGRLPVMSRERPGTLVAILTRSDVLRAYRRRLHESTQRERGIRLGWLGGSRRR